MENNLTTALEAQLGFFFAMDILLSVSIKHIGETQYVPYFNLVKSVFSKNR